MNDRLGAWLARIDALAARERALVFAAGLGLIYLAWSQLLFEPLAAQRDQLAAEVDRTQAQMERLNREIGELAQARARDPDASERARLAELRSERKRINETLQRVTQRLVPPEKMAGLLEAVLTRETDLTLVRLEGLGVSPVGEVIDGAETSVLEPPDGTPDGTDVSERARGLFRHGLRIELRGGYLETLQYLNALESLPWQFLWDSVELSVERYPQARISITVYSLSDNDAWIGV